MCACAFRNGSRSVLETQGFTTILPASSFSSGNTYSRFMFYRCVSKPKFLMALSKVKDVDDTLDKKILTDDHVKKLAELADNGTDMQVWGVNIKQLLGSIKFTNEELTTASCQIAFANE